MTRRLAALFGAAALISCACVGADPAVPAKPDAKTEALLKEISAGAASLQTLTADIVLTQVSRDSSGKLQVVRYNGAMRLKKPNLAIIVVRSDTFSQTVASDGKSLFQTLPGQFYTEGPVDAQGRNINVFWASPINLFFNTTMLSPTSKPGPVFGVAPPETLGGRIYEILTVSSQRPVVSVTRYYVSPEHLTLKAVTTVRQALMDIQFDATLLNVRVNPPLADSDFAYTPPAGSSRYVIPPATK